MKSGSSPEDVITFIRKRDYRFVRELGRGACGVTVLLHDDEIDEKFVCKKFSPCDGADHAELFTSFVREIKLLHRVLHVNVVRVFNYYLYPESYTGYILMEYVDGKDIETFIKSSPEQVNEVFVQAVSGFAYLEANGILHRDIRPGNVMVGTDGRVRIIDFGFGKQINVAGDYNKSISLNWWCDELPREFADNIYDYRTEVYFVGKLFEQLVREAQLDSFKYSSVLSSMCERDPSRRAQRFADVEKAVQSDLFLEIGFAEGEIECYRDFADAIEAQVTKIESSARYQEDVDAIQARLETVYRSSMLEETFPDARKVANCIIKGMYYYKKKGMRVDVVRAFIHCFKSISIEKKKLVLANLQTRLDAILRYTPPDPSDDLPF